MAYDRCITLLRQAAGRPLTDAEVTAVFERVHKAALDLNAGRVEPDDPRLKRSLAKAVPFKGPQTDSILQKAAMLAAEDLKAEAALLERQAELQVLRLAGLNSTYRALINGGIKPI